MNKSELLNWLKEEYRQWEALLDQIGLARMDQPGVNGDWSMKDVVAHLTGWNRWLILRLQAAGRGDPEPPPPWPAQIQAEDEINAWIYESNRGRSLREVLDEDLAGEPVDAVDAHRVGAADAVRAGASQRKRRVLEPLDLVETVQEPVHGLGPDGVVLVLHGGASSTVLEPFTGPTSILLTDGPEHLRHPARALV